MRFSILHKIICLTLLLILTTIGCKEEKEKTDELKNQEITDFIFIPDNPNSKEETYILFQGCNYYETNSVVIDKNNINIRKYFNSQLKWPCMLVNDTISLGKLKKGDYEVTLSIIDLNPFTEDSVFYSRTQSLTVINK